MLIPPLSSPLRSAVLRSPLESARGGAAAPYVIAPTITSPADAATDIGETPTITSSAFASSDGLDTHAHTDWKATSDAAGTTVIVQSLDDSGNLESWTIPAGNLTVSTQTYIWARHHGTSYGDSAWSVVSSFTTAGAFSYTWTNSEGSAYEAQCSTTGWDDTFRGDVDTLISSLKTAGTWTKHDRIQIDTPNEADSLRYLNAPTLTATANDTPIFTANRGFTQTGTSTISTNFVPSTDAVQYALNSAKISIWLRTAGATGSYYMIAHSGGYTSIQSHATLGLYCRGPNTGNSVINGSSSSQNAPGWMSLNRTSSEDRQIYLNGAEIANGTSTATALPAVEFVVGAPAGCQISAIAIGAGLTPTEEADTFAAFNAYRTARELV